ncbi:MAG: diaminopimelate decarboxylase [Lautropia sp.]|nr:diaminopimelate decarboxylase [Lautropia sp.]
MTSAVDDRFNTPDTWLRRTADGTLTADGQNLLVLAGEYGTPLYVYSRQMIESTWLRFMNALAGRNAQICYAVKANPNLAILELYVRLGAKFDVVSGGELARVIAAGGAPERVVFSGVGKSSDEIRQALTLGIGCFNIESLPELLRVNQIAGELDKCAPVALRINPDVDAATHPYISTGLKENKFGIPHSQAVSAYRQASALPYLDIQGIDCHIGSQITDVAPFLAALDKILLLIDQLQTEGISIRHLDLGGGLGIRYDEETPPTPDMLMTALFTRLQQWRPAGDLPGVTFEFGRALIGNAGLLLTCLEYLKDNEGHHFAIVDAAMNDLIRPALYQAYHRIEVVNPAQTAPVLVDVVGPVCESGDWLGKSRRLALPADAVLAILSAGAYCSSMASNYNSRPRPTEILVDHGHVHIIRTRETAADMLRQERHLPPHC